MLIPLKHFIIAYNSVYYTEKKADISPTFAFKLHSMGSVPFRQTSMNKFAPLKSITKLFPVPSGGVMIKGEEGNSLILRFARFIVCYMAITSSPSWSVGETLKERFKQVSWLNSHFAWFHVSGRKLANI